MRPTEHTSGRSARKIIHPFAGQIALRLTDSVRAGFPRQGMSLPSLTILSPSRRAQFIRPLAPKGFSAESTFVVGAIRRNQALLFAVGNVRKDPSGTARASGADPS